MPFADIFRGIRHAVQAAPVHESRAPLGDRTRGSLVRDREISIGYDGFFNNIPSGDREEMLGVHRFPIEVRHKFKKDDPADCVIDAVTDVENLLRALMKRPELNSQGLVNVAGWAGPAPTASGDELVTRLLLEVIDLLTWTLEDP